MSITTGTYSTENLIAGRVVSAEKTIATGTYYAGQLLGRVDATNLYAPYNSGGVDGTENVRGVVVETRTLAAQGTISVYITGTEVQKGGLVDASGDPLTVTAAIIEACQDGGIIVKEN